MNSPIHTVKKESVKSTNTRATYTDKKEKYSSSSTRNDSRDKKDSYHKEPKTDFVLIFINMSDSNIIAILFLLIDL